MASNKWGAIKVCKTDPFLDYYEHMPKLLPRSKKNAKAQRCCRTVTGVPACKIFKPAGMPALLLEEVVLSIDEFEAIRLADLEGLYHKQTAERMNIPRQTFGRIDEGENDIILLDVRTPAEFAAMRLPYKNVIHMPLGVVRGRASELPKDRDILAFCKVSMRGYEAQLILNAAGFERVWFIEGGLLGWPFEVLTSG